MGATPEVQRYCYLRPLNPCSANTSCTTYTCNPTGPCIETDIGAACPSTDICKKPECNPSTGCLEVDKTAAEIAMLCNDNNACTIDTCSNNTCIYTPRVCPATGDQCTESFCDPTSGCGTRSKNASAIAALCNDNNLCTTDSCASNACVYTPSVTCPNNTACAQYTCNPATGSCDETLTVCNDNDLCTTDTCNPLTGCVYTAVTCNDNSRCTIDTCNPLTGCVFTNVTCNDTNACTVDTCNPAIGCIYSQIVCDDNMTTTVDSCNATTGCIYTPITCNDNNNCTQDVLTPGGCVYNPISCNDQNPCTDDSCDIVTGCVYTNKVCTPADPACQVSRCVQGTCVNEAIVCDDGNPCTTDSCVAGSGCQYLPFNCSGVSTCFDYVCQPANLTGQPECVVNGTRNCDDLDSCTTDSCIEGIGCRHLNITCGSTTECDFPVGCIGTGPVAECVTANITSLFDFCGVCKGDNTACFFSSVIGTPAIAGISAGVAAGIAVAAVIAALIVAFLSKKGYDYYKAQSDNAAAGMHQNPYFKTNQLAGDMPGVDA